jgi:hypothetical protein
VGGLYQPTPRRRLSENSRPEFTDLAAHAATIAELSIFWREKWRNLGDYTEAAYVEKALSDQDLEAQTWEYPASEDDISIVCRNNLDVYSGIPGNYERFHGNLRKDGAQAIFHSALDRGPVSNDELYFTTNAFPPIPELARNVGIADGTRIYFSAVEMRQLWLDSVLTEYRRF